MDSSVASPRDDGAGEKLVEEKNGHDSKAIEVKYVTPTSQNGDAKIDIDNLKTAFAGMGKEELMKFANDPFWVRTRWFLFILFWLLWIAMLAGAIAIIVLAPKCAPPTPREWWEQSPVYKADVGIFSKESPTLQGDLKGFTKKLDYLQNLGVKTVVLSNILKVSSKDSDGVDEFKTVAPTFGTLDDVTALITAAGSKGLKLILTLVPNHSSLKNPLFNQSLSKESSFASYYVWGPERGFDQDGKRVPPNNWLSVNTENSSWEWNENRGAFYLHQFAKEEPEFNFHNPDVVKYFDDVMAFWLGKGVSGFYLERAAYLLEDKELMNETQRSRDIGSATHTDYSYYEHPNTKNRPELAPLLTHWKQLVANHSGILILDDVSVKSNRSIAHITVTPQTVKPYPALSAEDVFDLFNKTLNNNPWPAWQVKIENEPDSKQLSNALLLTTLLLPGITVTEAGRELGLAPGQLIPWANISDGEVPTQSKQPLRYMFSQLVEARASPSILHGSREMRVFNGTSALGYARVKSGNPGYLVVLNVGDEPTEVDARLLNSVPDELTLLASSDSGSQPKSNKVESQAVNLPARSVVAFTFVPKSKE